MFMLQNLLSVFSLLTELSLSLCRPYISTYIFPQTYVSLSALLPLFVFYEPSLSAWLSFTRVFPYTWIWLFLTLAASLLASFSLSFSTQHQTLFLQISFARVASSARQNYFSERFFIPRNGNHRFQSAAISIQQFLYFSVFRFVFQKKSGFRNRQFFVLQGKPFEKSIDRT